MAASRHPQPKTLPPIARSTGRRPANFRAGGFTLMEMLIVMAVIVLALTLALPLVRAMTGVKSEEAAQNAVSAYLASARADAVGIQDVEGVLFYIDPVTGRTTCQEVAQSPAQSGDLSGVVYLDLEGSVHGGKSRDPLPLPASIRVMTIKDTTSTANSYTDPFATSRYLGFNSYLSSSTMLGGVILFDGDGRLYSGPYGFRFKIGATITPMGVLAFGTGTPSSSWPTSTTLMNSQIAFAFFDHQAFIGQGYLENNNGSGNTNGQQVAQDAWLDANTTPMFVNRYNGSLTRAE